MGFNVYAYKNKTVKIAWFLSLTDAIYYVDELIRTEAYNFYDTEVFVVDCEVNKKVYEA